jgi:hypothetical protein
MGLAFANPMEAPTDDLDQRGRAEVTSGSGGEEMGHAVANPMEAPMDDLDPGDVAKNGDAGKVTEKGEAVGVKETSKATKTDDAEVAVDEWDKRLVASLGLRLNAETAKAATTLRTWGLVEEETGTRLLFLVASTAGVPAGWA